MYDAAILSNRTLTPGGMRKAAVMIRNGLIAAVLPELPAENCPITDVGNKVLMPGIIDPHVHINEPGRTSWEGFDTATRASIAGGITMLVDMPLNSSPVTTTAESFNQKTTATANQLHTNCGFWGGLIPGNAGDIEPLVKKGVLGFKTFLTESGIIEFPAATEKELRISMPVIAAANLPLLVHCEISEPPTNGKADPRSYQNYLASRPKKWEDNAITLMIRLCETYRCRTHIVHLSSADSISQIEVAKQKGLPLTAETCQHYLYFNAEEIGDGRTIFKCAPPIREKSNNERLWRALQDGIIDYVATDHSPAPPEMKELQSGDFMKAWGGISSIQFALPVLWTAARKRGCGIEKMAKWLSEKPAVISGQQNNKGTIAEGFDADLVVWDPEKEFTVSAGEIIHKHKITPYLGAKLYGVVEQTYLKGIKVFERGKFLHLNRGKLILQHRDS